MSIFLACTEINPFRCYKDVKRYCDDFGGVMPGCEAQSAGGAKVTTHCQFFKGDGATFIPLFILMCTQETHEHVYNL